MGWQTNRLTIISSWYTMAQRLSQRITFVGSESLYPAQCTLGRIATRYADWLVDNSAGLSSRSGRGCRVNYKEGLFRPCGQRRALIRICHTTEYLWFHLLLLHYVARA